MAKTRYGDIMEDSITFEDLGLDEQILAAVARKGFETPSPIQVLAIPRLLNGEANVIARARTGTGKTAAFGLPLIQRLRGESDHVRALILEPTRELAVQTCREMDSFSDNGKPTNCVVYGGASIMEQIRSLKKGADIVTGTPGRVQDLIERKKLDLSKIEYFILDEGDEMLDMGFIDDIENIFANANPDSRILLFSATMPAPILKIAQKFMGEYEIVEEEGIVEEALLIDQKYWVLREGDKVEALVRLIDSNPDFYGLVFTQTKSDADMVSRRLDEKGYEAAALHGDIPQSQREKILARFRSKKTRILVATDVAARGIDISGLSHVVNYSLPFDASTYVHRIGRTGRAGRSGKSFTLVGGREMYKLREIERICHTKIEERRVPSAKEITRVKSQKVFGEVIDIIENGDIASTLEFVNQKIEEGEYTAEQLAAGFMKLKMGADIEDLVLFEKDRDYGDRRRRGGRDFRYDERTGKRDRRRGPNGGRRASDMKKGAFEGRRATDGKRGSSSGRRKFEDRRGSDNRRSSYKNADLPERENTSPKPRRERSSNKSYQDGASVFENVGRLNIKDERSTKAWYMGEDKDTMNVSKSERKNIKAENKKRSIDYLQDVDDLVMESFGKRKK